MAENHYFGLIKSRFSLPAINRIYGNIPNFSFPCPVLAFVVIPKQIRSKSITGGKMTKENIPRYYPFGEFRSVIKHGKGSVDPGSAVLAFCRKAGQDIFMPDAKEMHLQEADVECKEICGYKCRH